MNALGQESALLEIESELKQVFVWSGNPYPCIIGARNESKTLGDGGYALSAALELVCRTSVFPDSTPPPLKSIIVVNGRRLQISSVLHSLDGDFVVLSADDPTQGV